MPNVDSSTNVPTILNTYELFTVVYRNADNRSIEKAFLRIGRGSVQPCDVVLWAFSMETGLARTVPAPSICREIGLS